MAWEEFSFMTILGHQFLSFILKFVLLCEGDYNSKKKSLEDNLKLWSVM